MGAGLWWLSAATTPTPTPTPDQRQEEEENLIVNDEIKHDNSNHEIMHSTQPWWGPETVHEKSLRTYIDNLEREHEANRVRWADYSCRQTKPSEWFDIKSTNNVCTHRQQSHGGNGIVNSTYVDDDDDDDKKTRFGVDVERKRSNTNLAMKEYKWLEESRIDKCRTIRHCTCLEPFSSCHQEPHYHHQSFHPMPICCGNCDGHKMTCWCIEHNWPASRMDYVSNLCKQQEDKDKPMYNRNYGWSRRPCRRKYERCEDQPCPHTFAEWSMDPRTREWTWKYV